MSLHCCDPPLQVSGSCRKEAGQSAKWHRHLRSGALELFTRCLHRFTSHGPARHRGRRKRDLVCGVVCRSQGVRGSGPDCDREHPHSRLE